MNHVPEYRVLFAADVQSSAGRGNTAQLMIRQALFTAARDAFETTGVQWDECHHEDTGDGMRIAVPGRVPKAVMIHPFAFELALRLRQYNELSGPAVRIALRCALHAGDVFITDGRLAGTSLEFLARLLEAPPARSALAAAGEAAPSVLAISQHVYDETVGHGYPGIDPGAFRQAAFRVKETTAQAWFTMPGFGIPSLSLDPLNAASEPTSPSVPAAPGGLRAQGLIYKSPMHSGVGDQNITY